MRSIESDEIWKTVNCLSEFNLEASNYGRIKNHGNIVTPWVGPGYFVVYVTNGDRSLKLLVHRLVCSAFNLIPKNINKSDQFNFLDDIPYIVNHKDGNKLNNVPDNLEWCDQRHNSRHAYLTGLWAFAIKINIHDLHTNEIESFNSLKDAASYLNVQPSKVIFISKLHNTIPYKGRFLIIIENQHYYKNKDKSKNERQIIVKDYRTNVVSIYRSINSAIQELSVTKQTIVNNLFRFDKKRKDKLTNGFVFRSLERALEPWPVYDYKDVIASIDGWNKHLNGLKDSDLLSFIVTRNGNLIGQKFNTLKEALDAFGLKSKYSTANRHFRKTNNSLIINDITVSKCKLD